MDLTSILGQLGGATALQAQAMKLAQDHGVSPEIVSQLLSHLGGQASAGVSDPSALAQSGAAATGLDASAVMAMVQSLMANSGGLTAMLDADKDGSIVDDVIGMAGKLFTKS
ncbi:hypothetical protein [Sandaracinobacteroides saxicola]|uniref:DUF937 domain-containing protein n=1 Tax=Sandaracinobacteroides saxicola TaxID=2759707 RepID=A0A7G5IL98_9SPHN|nr:hypothetical protein [Sandaracinobacteroides saxicola]QMW24140.1 hypothetical protein H3309_06695 [Sandaracinobacteroides saxicola]